MAVDKRIPHAILLHGIEGVGKYALARALAQYLHCEAPTPDDSCGKCPSCIQHQSLNHIDTIHVYPVVKTDKLRSPISADYADQWREYLDGKVFMDFAAWTESLDKKNAQPVIYVGESAWLEEKLSVTTAVSAWKIVLMWLPEKMNEQTANKLLKLIEEPFSDTIFILVSNDAAGVLPTIRSRCRPIEVPRMSDADVAGYIQQKFGLSYPDAMATAHLAEGSVTAARRQMDATKAQRMFLDLFIGLMRKAYQRNVAELKNWANDLAALGREQQMAFYGYCQRLIRENFVYNFSQPELSYLNTQEEQFSQKFARFITVRNAEPLIRVLNQAAIDIAGNANAKIVNFDLAVKVIMLIKNG